MKARFKHELEGRTLLFSKRGKDGKFGEQTIITPGVSKTGAKSDLSYFISEPHFKYIRKAVEYELARLSNEDRKHFRPRRTAILKGLRWAGEHLGFEIPELKDSKDDHLLWRCNGQDGHRQSFVEWRVLNMNHEDRPFRQAKQVADHVREKNERFERLERKSKALMRDAYVVFNNTCMLVPALLRKDKDSE